MEEQDRTSSDELGRRGILRGWRILPHLRTILEWSDQELWPTAPSDWLGIDVEYREWRVRPPCMICGGPANFCRVIEIDGRFYWADLCSEHLDPDHLIGLS